MKNGTDNTVTRIRCLALFFCALAMSSPGAVTAGPMDKGSVDMVDEAVRDMQWREKVERPRSRPPQPSPTGTNQGLPVAPPDLSGLPRTLPEVTPQLPPVAPAPSQALTKPALDARAGEKQTLVKPRMGTPSAQAPASAVRKKVSEPARESVSVTPRRPDAVPGVSQSVKAAPSGPRTDPKIVGAPGEKQALVRPRMGHAPTPDRAAVARKKAPEPAASDSHGIQARPAPQHPNRVPTQGGPTNLAQPASKQIPRYTAAPSRDAKEQPIRPQGAAKAAAGLIKPRLGGY